MSEWTKGPWNFSRELNVFEVSPADEDAPSVAFVVAAPDLEHAAFSAEYFAENVQNTKFPLADEAYANARLMAAAPDLFEALAGILRTFDVVDIVDSSIGGAVVRADEIDAARAALAKAKP